MKKMIFALFLVFGVANIPAVQASSVSAAYPDAAPRTVAPRTVAPRTVAGLETFSAGLETFSADGGGMLETISENKFRIAGGVVMAATAVVSVLGVYGASALLAKLDKNERKELKNILGKGAFKKVVRILNPVHMNVTAEGKAGKLNIVKTACHAAAEVAAVVVVAAVMLIGLDRVAHDRAGDMIVHNIPGFKQVIDGMVAAANS